MSDLRGKRRYEATSRLSCVAIVAGGKSSTGIGIPEETGRGTAHP